MTILNVTNHMLTHLHVYFNCCVHGYKFYFDGCFSRDPDFLNSLPDHVKLGNTLNSFKNKVKAYLFVMQSITEYLSPGPNECFLVDLILVSGYCIPDL